MNVRYSRRALRQLEQILSYIEKDNPAAAAAVAGRIESLVALLGRYQTMGRPTDNVVFYKILPDRDEVRILRVRHTARRSLATPEG
jgi:toxin ParE1/3/4